MNERDLLTTGIRFIGLWWVLEKGGSYAYFVLVKLLGLPTTSITAVNIDVQALIFDFVIGVIIIGIAPRLAGIILGRKKPEM